MARPLRLEHPGAVWHLISRGNNEEKIYLCDEDRVQFLGIVAEAVRRFRWVVHSYVLMSTHFHLVLETPEMTLSRGMKWMNGKYAQWFNRRYDRHGHLFQGRFKGFLVEKENYLLALARYVVLNPVRACMVKRPEDYRWSSYRATAGLEPAPPWLAVTNVLQEFGSDLAMQQRNYGEFVEAGVGIEDSPLDDAVGQLFLGSASWIEKMQGLIDAKPRSTEHPEAQRLVGRPSVAQIIEVVAEVFKNTPEGIRSSHGGIERKAVSWLGCYEGMRRLGGIAAALRLRSTSRVSAMIADCDRELSRDATLRTTVDRCIELLRRNRVALRTTHQESYPSVAFGR